MPSAKKKKLTHFKQRLQFLMDEYSLGQSELEQKAGLYNGQAGIFLKGKTEPTLRTVQKLLKLFKDVDAEWLVMGTGNVKR
jgi:transcriptional regulator with XRE-family HTH domain